MTMPVSMLVIVMVPVAFVVAPALLIVVVVGMGPVSAGIGRVVVMSGNPTIVVSLRRPEAPHPDHPYGGWWRRGRLIRYRWWSNAHKH